MHENTSILEKRSSIYVLLTIRENPGILKTEVMSKDPGNGKTRFVRIGEFIDAGLVEYKKIGRCNQTKLYLTAEGQEVAGKLDGIDKIMATIKKEIKIGSE